MAVGTNVSFYTFSVNQLNIYMIEKPAKDIHLQIKKYDWTYSFKTENGKQSFDIIPDKPIDKPTVLNKLYSLNKHSVDALLKGQIYAAHPAEFNDPFDCYEDILNFDDEGYIRYFLRTFAPEEFPDDRIDKEIKVNFKWVSTFVKRNFREFIYKFVGVVSMTSSPMSIVMWSYYNNHKGFFIEFDLTAFPFKFHGPFPLNYQKEIDPISINECGPGLGMLLQTNLKFKDWEHENEWRLLIESEESMISTSFETLKKLGGKERTFDYPIKAIRKIGFGNRFFDPHELIILSDRESNVILIEDEFNKENIKYKADVLDFIIANDLDFYMALRDGIWKKIFAPVKVTKLIDKKYSLIMTEVKM
jgi:hypothetical protein